MTATNDFGRVQLRPLLDRFQALHPGIHMSLLLSDSTVNLIDEHIDLALRNGPLADSGLLAFICRAVTEGHVDQHDQAQPASLGHEHLGSARGEESVEQRHRTIGDLPHHTSQGSEGRRVRARPAPDHGVLAHRPAERAEAPADLAVVGVASARPARVIDAVGYDEMHCRHSRRS